MHFFYSCFLSFYIAVYISGDNLLSSLGGEFIVFDCSIDWLIDWLTEGLILGNLLLWDIEYLRLLLGSYDWVLCRASRLSPPSVGEPRAWSGIQVGCMQQTEQMLELAGAFTILALLFTKVNQLTQAPRGAHNGYTSCPVMHAHHMEHWPTWWRVPQALNVIYAQYLEFPWSDHVQEPNHSSCSSQFLDLGPESS